MRPLSLNLDYKMYAIVHKRIINACSCPLQFDTVYKEVWHVLFSGGDDMVGRGIRVPPTFIFLSASSFHSE